MCHNVNRPSSLPGGGGPKSPCPLPPALCPLPWQSFHDKGWRWDGADPLSRSHGLARDEEETGAGQTLSVLFISFPPWPQINSAFKSISFFSGSACISSAVAVWVALLCARDSWYPLYQHSILCPAGSHVEPMVPRAMPKPRVQHIQPLPDRNVMLAPQVIFAVSTFDVKKKWVKLILIIYLFQLIYKNILK